MPDCSKDLECKFYQGSHLLVLIIAQSSSARTVPGMYIIDA